MSEVERSRDQETRRGGGAFHMDGRPAHNSGAARDVCWRCRTPVSEWREVECFYPATLREVALEAADMLENGPHGEQVELAGRVRRVAEVEIA